MQKRRRCMCKVPTVQKAQQDRPKDAREMRRVYMFEALQTRRCRPAATDSRLNRSRIDVAEIDRYTEARHQPVTLLPAFTPRMPPHSGSRRLRMRQAPRPCLRGVAKAAMPYRRLGHASPSHRYTRRDEAEQFSRRRFEGMLGSHRKVVYSRCVRLRRQSGSVLGGRGIVATGNRSSIYRGK